MIFKIKRTGIFFILSLLIFTSCDDSTVTFPEKEEITINPIETEEEIITEPLINSTINFSHFNHLYKELNFKEKKIGIIHIYSEYPNYEYAIEPNEGFTCVDDVARAIVMLSKYLEVFGSDDIAIEKMKNLTEFVLQMQNENGYFNNFLWENLTINTTYQTSIAELNWWSLRALWGLENAYTFLQSDTEIASRIELAIQKLTSNIKRDIPITNLNTEFVDTIELPTWLPQKNASDQSALLILGLLKNYERTFDNDAKLLIDFLAKGIMVMQKGNVDRYPYGAFLSSGNLWHAWGNSQSYALLKAGIEFNNQEYIDTALLEINNFYPFMLNNGFAEAFRIKNETGNYIETNRNDYPQIAYGLRPMVLATSKAYQYLKEENYLTLAKNLSSWLTGENDANMSIYNENTGVCFDGVVGANEVNKNSGAESAIESLFILIEMEKLK